MFLVAGREGVVVGTGALRIRPEPTAEIVRMSVAAEFRRQGVASAVLARLLEEARGRGRPRVVLAPSLAWDGARAFYVAAGFKEIARTDAGVVFERLI